MEICGAIKSVSAITALGAYLPSLQIALALTSAGSYLQTGDASPEATWLPGGNQKSSPSKNEGMAGWLGLSTLFFV